MTSLDRALTTIQDERAASVLARLHHQADRQNVKLVGRFFGQLPRLLWRRKLPWQKLEPTLSDMYLALDPGNGALCYLLARALCGNAAVFPADHADYLTWVRDPKNGFRSMHLPMKLAGELSVRVG